MALSLRVPQLAGSMEHLANRRGKATIGRIRKDCHEQWAFSEPSGQTALIFTPLTSCTTLQQKLTLKVDWVFASLHPHYTPPTAVGIFNRQSQTWRKSGRFWHAWRIVNGGLTEKRLWSRWSSCLPLLHTNTPPTPKQEISNYLVLTGTCWTIAISIKLTK